MSSEYEEEYLETIYSIIEGGKPAKTNDIANILNVKPASVTEMLKKLAESGYVEYRPYYGATLTKKGLHKGRKLKRKHRLLERFLHDFLGIRKEKVHDEACRMEHGLSDETTEALDRAMNYPERCPDDDKPIPPEGRKLGEGERILSNLSAGEKAKVARLEGGRGFQSNLRTIGVREGKIIEVVAREPAGGPVVARIESTTVTIGRGMASKIIVK